MPQWPKSSLCDDCNLGKGKLYFGNYMRLVQDGYLQPPRVRSPMRPPLPYQRDALGQIIEHIKRSGVSHFTLLEFARAIAAPGLRDGINPIFEPLTFATAEEGFAQLVAEGRLLKQKGELFILL
jgi:hypothetical protein